MRIKQFLKFQRFEICQYGISDFNGCWDIGIFANFSCIKVSKHILRLKPLSDMQAIYPHFQLNPTSEGTF